MAQNCYLKYFKNNERNCIFLSLKTLYIFELFDLILNTISDFIHRLFAPLNQGFGMLQNRQLKGFENNDVLYILKIFGLDFNIINSFVYLLVDPQINYEVSK